MPFNARSNWHVFAKPSQQHLREELLSLLGQHNAIVLCGHLHKTNFLTRNTPKGNFVQVCIGSVIDAPNVPVKDYLQGLDAYNADLVRLEPNFAPASLAERRENLTKEAPFVKYFEYADFCGYGTLSITHKNQVMLSVYANMDRKPWKTINLSSLLRA